MSDEQIYHTPLLGSAEHAAAKKPYVGDPMAPDAPLLSLLSARDNRMLAEASEDYLVSLVKKLRQHAVSAPTIAAADNAAGAKVVKPRVPSAKKQLLDSL